MVYLVTHTDLDGTAPEVLVRLIWKPHQVTVIPCEAHEVDKAVDEVLESICNEDRLYIVDCAPSAEKIEQLNQCKFKKFLFDHHMPKFNINAYDWTFVDLSGKESGTSLFCKHLEFPKNEISKFADLVRRWDTWEWKQSEDDLEPSKLNQLLLLMGREDFVKHCVDLLSENEPVLNEFASRLVYYKEQEIKSYIENKLKFTKIVDYKGEPCAVIMAESYKSQLGSAIMEHFDVNLVAVIGTQGVSLRSRGNVNVSKIAIENGGGGSFHTGGFPISDEIKDAYVNAILGNV